LTSALSSKEIQDYLYLLLKQGYSEKTVRDIWGIMKNFMRFSTSNGMDLGIDVSQISIKKRKSEVHYLEIEEQKKLCSYLVEHITYKNYGILLALYTGIRIGELCALKWEDINFNSNTLSVTKTLIRIPVVMEQKSNNKTKVIITRPKSDDSIRDIPIPKFLSKIASDLIINQDNFLLSGTQKYIEPRNMQYYFQKTLDLNGIQRINFHALRHTFATRCIENSFDIKTLSEILGHSNIKTTLELYVHSSMELKRKNMDKLSLIQI
jgi:integrase